MILHLISAQILYAIAEIITKYKISLLLSLTYPAYTYSVMIVETIV